MKGFIRSSIPTVRTTARLFVHLILHIHYSTHLLLSIQSIGSVLAHVCILFLIPQTLTERFTSCCFVTLSPIPASIATELDHAQKFPNFVILFVTNGLLFYWYICDINIVSISRSNEDIVKVKTSHHCGHAPHSSSYGNRIMLFLKFSKLIFSVLYLLN